MLLQIPDGALALGLGTALAVGAAAMVLRPLVREAEESPTPSPAPSPQAPEQASAVEALREIEFDRATGKLSDSDYASLRATYTREALTEMRARDRAAGPAVDAPPGAAIVTPLSGADDAVEAALRDYRARAPRCPVHGARPQGDARFCSDCGRFLAGRCPGCGAACDDPEQRFCRDCGTALAA
jgi:hypothetical protein